MNKAAVEAALDKCKHPAKAERFFYLLRLIAGNRWIIEYPVKAVVGYFKKPSIYRYINQLEEVGAIRRVMGGWRGKEIVEVRLLKSEIKIALKKRGRKPNQDAVPAALRENYKEDVAQIRRRNRVVIFFDENEFIRSVNNGLNFDFDSILEKVQERFRDDDIIRVFAYISAKTEEYNKKDIWTLFGPDRPSVRYIKTGNQPGVVDRRMREDMIFWSDNNLADVFVLATADGGLDFQLAVEAIKRRNHAVVILEVAGVIGQTIAKNAHGIINATPANPRVDAFQKIVIGSLTNSVDMKNEHAGFIFATAKALHDYLTGCEESRFTEILTAVWSRLTITWRPGGYSRDDAKAAINALIHKGRALNWHIEGNGKFFRLNNRSLVWNSLLKLQTI